EIYKYQRVINGNKSIIYKKEKEWFVGHIQKYPDYESQGKTI
ncbi:MAG: hypothetical protein, partial [Olavius algarvensis Gamma 1 endosymbiont]